MDDLIKRSDAIKIMACEMYAEAQSQGYEVDSIEDFMPEAKAWMNDAPSADRPQGEWSIDSVDEIELSYGGTAYEPVYKCSHCGRTTESYVRFDEPLMPEDANFPKFCGWCGARMKGADDE